jgi:hypothetical protein
MGQASPSWHSAGGQTWPKHCCLLMVQRFRWAASASAGCSDSFYPARLDFLGEQKDEAAKEDLRNELHGLEERYRQATTVKALQELRATAD